MFSKLFGVSPIYKGFYTKQKPKKFEVNIYKESFKNVIL